MPKEPSKTHYRVEALGRHHDRSQLSCGSELLDRYLREQARQDARKHVTAPFVFLDADSSTVLGYYTLSALSIDVGAWPESVARKLPKYPLVPATLLGRLAIDERLQGTGAGEYLLMDALRRSWEASRQVASTAVIVDAKDERAAAFYARYEFKPFANQRGRFYLAMGVIETLFA